MTERKRVEKSEKLSLALIPWDFLILAQTERQWTNLMNLPEI